MAIPRWGGFHSHPYSLTISPISFVCLFHSGRLSVMTAKENPMASENSYQDFFSTIEAKEASTNEIFKKVGVCLNSFAVVVRTFLTVFVDFVARIP